MSFAGLPKETFEFLEGIRANNDKTWFEAHRDDYEEFYLEPARDLVVAAGERLEQLAPGIEAQPKVLGSIFRINRDTRFSKDKRPYKDHLDLWFWEGERKQAVSGFFVRILPDLIGVGVGSHGFDKTRLITFREAVTTQPGADLAAIADDIAEAGFEIDGQHYKRDPAGFETSGPGARFIRHNALFVHHDLPVGSRVHGPGFVDDLLGVWTPLAGLHRWIVDTLQ